MRLIIHVSTPLHHSGISLSLHPAPQAHAYTAPTSCLACPPDPCPLQGSTLRARPPLRCSRSYPPTLHRAEPLYHESAGVDFPHSDRHGRPAQVHDDLPSHHQDRVSHSVDHRDLALACWHHGLCDLRLGPGALGALPACSSGRCCRRPAGRCRLCRPST